MKARAFRTVLGVYGADEGEPSKAFDAARKKDLGSVSLFSPDGTEGPDNSYSALRLSGEYLLVARAEPAKLQTIIQSMRSWGVPAVFLLPNGSGAPVLEPLLAPSGEPLADFARQCAERRSAPGSARQDLFTRLQESKATLDTARGDLTGAARLDHGQTAAAEWLLDNGYLIQTEVSEIGRILTRGYQKLLPVGASGLPYVYELAAGLVAHTDSSLNEANIEICLNEYQKIAPLTIAELWAFPLMLRIALIEALAGLALRVSKAQQLREAAYFWANRLAASARRGPKVFEGILGQLTAQPIALQTYFLISLAEQLQDEEEALDAVQRWIEQRVETPLTEIVRAEHTLEAAECVSTANAFGSLRALARIDFTGMFEAVSLMDAELRADPGGVYAHSDFSTRDMCRRVVEQISRLSGVGEIEVARRAVKLAEQDSDPRTGHVAYYLLSDGVTRIEAETRARKPLRTRFIRALRKRATGVYVTGVIGLTACFTAMTLSLAWDAGIQQRVLLATLGVLALFPLSELVTQIVNALVISLFPPDTLPKLNFKDGIPAEHTTLVVVPMMLSSVEVVRREVEKLEVRFLATKESNLYFSLFSDFPDAADATGSDDAELLQTARDGITDLNARYPGGRFLLFHRNRQWSDSEQCWIGKERKRGKIEELNAYLCGEGSEEIVNTGSLPAQVRYVITLDADTQLPPGAARRMVETIAHPLNRVEIDPVTRVRKRGFTIIQPRVSITLPGAMATRFTRVFADTTGTDPYCQTVSDAQQDLFGEAIFHGKAIYDVKAFATITGNRFPAETLLSHDLIEGAHAGVGLATDIELFENLPLDYVGYSRRQHRWIRGDWQIAPWIFSHVPAPGGVRAPNPLPGIGRWRILDNLRRSLAPAASLMLLLFGWLISPAPGVWSLVVGLAFGVPTLAPLLDRSARRLQGTVQGWQGAADELVRAIVMFSFLPHQAWLSMDAIFRSCFRRYVSRRNLLEWQPAESTGQQMRGHLDSTLRQMWIISGLSLLLMMILSARGAFGPTSLFVALWVASPMLMKWLDRPAVVPERRRVSSADALYLRLLARQTWRFFDDLVGPDNNWLPPDNSQLALRVEVANRTSPTNVGFWLTSALAARDLGYLTTDELVKRASQTMLTLDKLERYEGHFLNWYDTKSLTPLPPRYLSTVDSGNLVASLWVLEQGCHEALRTPVIGSSCLRGLADTLSVLHQVCGGDLSLTGPLRALRRLLRGKMEGYELIARLRLTSTLIKEIRGSEHWHNDTADERAYWVSRLADESNSWTDTMARYLAWMETLMQPPDSFLEPLGSDAVKLRRRALHPVPSLLTLARSEPTLVDEILAWRNAPDLRPEVAAWIDRLAREYQLARSNAREIVQQTEALAASASQFADAVNMGFLYDSHRRLFAIGYAVGGPREFSSHYDLLASECRLASLVAIAKGEAPIEHWFALSRPHAFFPGGPTLLSWSGTMFEYLMPLLFTRTFANSVLDHSCHQAVQQQIDYGYEKGVPWGISESAYSAIDSNQIYQYRAFGVPKLALKQSGEDDLVVAPYSTVLALMVNPVAATDNLRRLAEQGLAGPMGLYEAIDYTRQTKRGGARGVVIYAYMAHHQGMSLLALDNVLHGAIMQRRFHGDLRIRAIEPLLFERIPVTKPRIEEVQTTPPHVRPAPLEEPAERTWKDATTVPRVNLHGNGRYSLMITNSGGGYSRWNEWDLTRWRPDTTRDSWGSFLYIRDLKGDIAWSPAHQPLGGAQDSGFVRFSADRSEFRRRLSGLGTVLDVTVASEDDVELRRLTVTNHSMRTRHIELTSYLELALAPHAADKSHPAFSKMFIETECVEPGVLIAHRRPRSPEDVTVWAAHVLVGPKLDRVQFETDRDKFLGRGNTAAAPAALRRDLTGSLGAVLDPIFSLRCRTVIEPRDRLEYSFLTIAAASREALLALVNKYRRSESITRAFEMAWTRAQLEFRYLGVGPSAAHRFQDLASHLLYPNPSLRLAGPRLIQNRLGQSALWGLGISGDQPMLLVTIADPRGLTVIRELLLAHAYWRLRGFKADLIILNQERSSYDRPLHQQLVRQIGAHAADAGIDRPGGVFLRDWFAIPEEHRNLILAASSVVLSAGRGPISQQLAAAHENVPPPPFTPAAGSQEEPSRPLPFLELPYFNGLGGFTSDAREYAIYLGPAAQTPAPWVNVMANPDFGAMVSESGLGFTWRGNSQSCRLTPWHNDPVSDPQSEVIYLRDEDSGAVWTPTALPIREKDAYRARHGQGYTVFEHNSHSIGQELTVFVPVANADPVKVYRLRLRNDSSHIRRLTVTYFAEWVLGATREDQQLHVQTMHDEESGAILARQWWSGEGPEQVAFAAASPRAESHSGDRTQFLGRNGSTSKPAAMEQKRLDNRTGAGVDPAAALQLTVSIHPGSQAEVFFLLGAADSVDAVRALVSRYQRPDQVESALTETRAWWDSKLGALEVRTPLLSTDFLINRWLLYQALSCRFWGRSALYQSSGAYGFRDQLQDSMAFLYIAPEWTRAHILTAAARQFPEGDVQHWWRPDTGLGVRTRCSDDLLWLPYVVARYIDVTGDDAILDEEIPFVDGPTLAEGEHEKMFIPAISARMAPLVEHCRLAIERGLTSGPHDLPLIGSCDWNDGMNRVGAEGRGESVWLGWFLCTVLDSFGRVIARRESGKALAAEWTERAAAIANSIEQSCWDGDWYLRAFFDTGEPLGSHANQEARIDSLAQSWAVISKAANPERARRGMESANRYLVDERGRLVRLLTPPFDGAGPNPGYIRGYPPGIRENGGQYTHGSLWLAMAWARMGDGATAVRLLNMMNPVELSRTPADVARYRVEPFVVAADVYSASGKLGRGGWTWYTGAAGWMYRVWIEEVLGFQLRCNRLTIKPVIPDDWSGFEITYRHLSAVYEIGVVRIPEGGPVLEVDGLRVPGDSIYLVDDGITHHVTVRIPTSDRSLAIVQKPAIEHNRAREPVRLE